MGSVELSDITVYGATGFVGKHIARYLLAASALNGQPIRLVLAGRNGGKLAERKESLDAQGSTIDTFVADASDLPGLTKMCESTKVVIACAGPFNRYGSNVVAACATTGTDYVDITGEFFWVAKMRQQYGEAAKKSGARIIPLCGFDSIPSDLTMFAAVQALREARGPNVEAQDATSWFTFSGVHTANAGTLHTMASIPIDLKKNFLDPTSGSIRSVPYFVDDPYCMAHPTLIRHNPDYDEQRNKSALAEWWNQLPLFHTNLGYGVSIPFFMAVVNAKVVNTTAVMLNYGPDWKYSERMLPLGFRWTRSFGVFSFIPAAWFLIGLMIPIMIIYIPFIGQKLLDTLYPPGSGAPDSVNDACSTDIYAEVTSTTHAREGTVDRAACHVTCKGDAGNLNTSQFVCEAAFSLLHNRSELPPKSQDGFGTPMELLGSVLVKRLSESKVRNVTIETKVEKDANLRSTRIMV